MRRGTRYYLRTRVPLDLIETIGRKEIWKSLETGDHREAVRRYHLAKAELDQEFEQRRNGSGPWIEMLAEVMQRVEYPGLNLSHLRTVMPSDLRRQPSD